MYVCMDLVFVFECVFYVLGLILVPYRVLEMEHGTYLCSTMLKNYDEGSLLSCLTMRVKSIGFRHTVLQTTISQYNARSASANCCVFSSIDLFILLPIRYKYTLGPLRAG